MENKLELLAKTALQSKNYEQAYDYYSKLLEQDIDNKDFWVGKAIASGYSSTLDKMRILETISLVNAAAQIQEFSDSEKISLSNELMLIADKKIIEGIRWIDSEIERKFNLLQIPAGTLYEVHKIRKLSIQIAVGNEYRPAILEIFELMELSCKLNPTKENFEKIIKYLNMMFDHSKRNVDYFGGLNDATDLNKKTLDIWNNASNKIKEIDPNAQVIQNTPQSSSGCFIATAAAGDYNHPSVLQLRYFRDDFLNNYVIGRLFIQFYYRNSPPIADYISSRPIIKKMVFDYFIKPFSRFTEKLN